MTTSLLAGTAAIDITPPVGVDLTGYVAREGASTGVHDHLHARALVLDDGRTRAALVVCDLVGFEVAHAAAIRAAIGAAIDVPTRAVMLTGTHTHSGPATIRLFGCGEVEPDYVAGLQPLLVESVRAAAAALSPVQVGIGRETFAGGLYNRRRDGAPVDASVGVACLRTPGGEIIAILVNYGCHPVVLEASNLLVSADYPGYLSSALQKGLREIGYFLTGACGNVDPARRGSFEDAEWLGEALADQAIHAMGEMDFRTGAPLSCVSDWVTLPLQPLPDLDSLAKGVVDYQAQLTAAEAAGDGLAARVAGAMREWAEGAYAAVAAGTAPRTVKAEIQVIRIGDVAVVGIPGELFSSLGARIKESGAAPHVLLAGYANGDVGYIPSPEAYEVGGYEVSDAYKYYGYPAALAAEAGKAIVETAIRLIRRSAR